METANTSYGELPTGSSASYVQTFAKASAQCSKAALSVSAGVQDPVPAGVQIIFNAVSPAHGIHQKQIAIAVWGSTPA
jgi:hypothetical protein